MMPRGGVGLDTSMTCEYSHSLFTQFIKLILITKIQKNKILEALHQRNLAATTNYYFWKLVAKRTFKNIILLLELDCTDEELLESYFFVFL